MKTNEAISYERGLLGLALVDESTIDKMVLYLSAEDFFDLKNKQIFLAMSSIREQGFQVEHAPVLKWLQENEKSTQVNEEYLTMLETEACLPNNVQKFMEAIVEKSRMRQVETELAKITDKLKNSNMTSDDVVSQIEADILSTARSEKQHTFRPANELIEEALEKLNQRMNGEISSGIRTGYAEFDEFVGGFKEGALIILAARPAMGKTALALNMAANIAKTKSVAFFSIEMSSVEIINRVIGFRSYTSGDKIANPKKFMSSADYQKVMLAKKEIEKLNLHVDDSPNNTLSEMVWKAKQLKKNKGLDIVFIDYLQLINMGTKTESRQNEVSIISRTLKKLAREIEAPVVALSQLSRKVEMRESKVPMMSDIRESGAIEQDADLIAFVYRDDYYKAIAQEDVEEIKDDQVTSIIIGKNRSGPTGKVDLIFETKVGLFIDKPKRGNHG